MEEKQTSGGKPEKKFRAGALSVTVWKNNQTKDGKSFDYNTVSVERGYKDPSGKWQNSKSLRVNDLPKVAMLLNEAFRSLVLNGTQQDEEVVL